MHFLCSQGQVPVADVALYRITENPCQIQKLSGFLLRLNETSGPVSDTNSGLMPSKSEFVERFPELSLFFKAYSLLDSEMICIFPYFCPYAESAREIREIFS